MKRERLTTCTREVLYVPTWQGAIEAWSRNFASINRWRMPTDMDYEDLVQELWLLFHKVSTKYDDVTNPKHFMRLFQTTVRNWSIKQAWNRTGRKERGGATVRTGVGSDGQGAGSSVYERTPSGMDHMQQVEYKMLLDDCPAELRPLVSKLVQQVEQEGAKVARRTFLRSRKQASGERETTNDRICRMCNVDPCEYDLRAMLVRWLSGTANQGA